MIIYSSNLRPEVNKMKIARIKLIAVSLGNPGNRTLPKFEDIMRGNEIGIMY